MSNSGNLRKGAMVCNLAVAPWRQKRRLISSCCGPVILLQVGWCAKDWSWVPVVAFCYTSLLRDYHLLLCQRRVVVRFHHLRTPLLQRLIRSSFIGSGALHISQENEGAPVDLLLEALRDDTICNLDSIATSNFEHMWASSSVPTSIRNLTLRSDIHKNLLTPLYDIGCLGQSCIVPRSELCDLVISLDSEAHSLDLFWGTIVGEFFDPI